ncbi:MAG: hypothetical protein P8Q37_02210 [Porticoccaceae bacterium]|nr:hypothetical protein [Porticoccaceae bacterium]MDG1473687.1 hypothetical protein [Porticoccaceae bacterium]
MPKAKNSNNQTPAPKIGPSNSKKFTLIGWSLPIAKTAPTSAIPIIIKNLNNNQIARKDYSENIRTSYIVPPHLDADKNSIDILRKYVKMLTYEKEYRSRVNKDFR